MTILSVNKTREMMGALCAFFVCGRGLRSLFYLGEDGMKGKTRRIAHGALLAALYVALTYLQEMLLPGSANWAIQFRASEALCVLAFFTPAAIPGLTVGCLLFNVSNAAALPLDFLVGSMATLLATAGMYMGRRLTVRGYPLPGMLLPALTNGLLVGWELTVYVGGSFWLNGLYVAIGEVGVLLTLGSILYGALKLRGLDKQLFA